jgi:hypothetical protein
MDVNRPEKKSSPLKAETGVRFPLGALRLEAGILPQAERSQEIGLWDEKPLCTHQAFAEIT